MPEVRTRRELLRAGPGDTWIRREVGSGRVETFAPGVYVGGEADLPTRLAACLAHTGPGAVITGWAGCQLLGIPGAAEQLQAQVLVGHARNLVSTAHVRVLPTSRPPRWRQIGDVKVAEPARCVVDAARGLQRLADVRHLVMAAIASRAVTLPALRAELEAGRRNGSALCRRALDDAARGAASAPEAELADLAISLAHRRRLPPFLLNPEVRCDGELIGYPDGWFVDLGLGWEVESREHHSGDENFDATLDRHGTFAGAGAQLLHVTPRRLRQLGPVYGEVFVRAVNARRAGGYRPAAGLVVIARFPLQPPPRRTRDGPCLMINQLS